MFAAPTTTQTVQDPVQAQSLAEPDALDGFDRSGHGVAQRRRAAILAGSSVQRKVVQRELDVTASPDGVSPESAQKLERVANTLNAMPFEQSMEIVLKTESGEKGAAPLRSKLAGEDEPTTTIFLQADYVESSPFEQILQACMNVLGSVILKNKADPADLAKLQKETVLAECSQIAEGYEESLKNQVPPKEGEPVRKLGFPSTQILAKLSDFLMPQAYEKVVVDRSESIQATLKKTTEITNAMNNLLDNFVLENHSTYPWMVRVNPRRFDPASVRASLSRLLSQRQGSGASNAKN
jgi:hypothetical protein